MREELEGEGEGEGFVVKTHNSIMPIPTTAIIAIIAHERSYETGYGFGVRVGEGEGCCGDDGRGG